MLTLNFECFYLFQSLFYSHFGRGFLGPRQTNTAGGTRAPGSAGLEARGYGEGGARPGAGLTHTHTQLPLPCGTPTPSPLARHAALRKAGAGGRCAVQQWRADQAPGGSGRGAVDRLGAAAAAAPRSSLRRPQTHAERLNYFQVWTT